MAGGITLDMTSFRRGLAAKLRATKQAAPAVANRAARNVCLKAASFTPAAIPAKIEAELRTNGLLFKILQSPATRAHLPPRVLAMMSRDGRLTRAQINAAAKALLQARRQSARAIRVGWIKAGQMLGATSSQRVSTKGLPGQSYGRQATMGTPVAEAANLARGAAAVGTEAMQRALNEVGADMAQYAARKLASPWQ